MHYPGVVVKWPRTSTAPPPFPVASCQLPVPTNTTFFLSNSVLKMNTVKLHFDILSPWSKVAFYTLRRYEKLWNLNLVRVDLFLLVARQAGCAHLIALCRIQEFHPVNQGYLMDFSNNKPPMTVANKGVWMMTQDLPRASKLFDGTFPVL